MRALLSSLVLVLLFSCGVTNIQSDGSADLATASKSMEAAFPSCAELAGGRDNVRIVLPAGSYHLTSSTASPVDMTLFYKEGSTLASVVLRQCRNDQCKTYAGEYRITTGLTNTMNPGPASTLYTFASTPAWIGKGDESLGFVIPFFEFDALGEEFILKPGCSGPLCSAGTVFNAKPAGPNNLADTVDCPPTLSSRECSAYDQTDRSCIETYSTCSTTVKCQQKGLPLCMALNQLAGSAGSQACEEKGSTTGGNISFVNPATGGSSTCNPAGAMLNCPVQLMYEGLPPEGCMCEVNMSSCSCSCRCTK